jgi:copper(I)-binding protein
MKVGFFLATAVMTATMAAAAAPAVSVSGAWTRPTATAGMNAAGYLTLVNRGNREARLVAASSPDASSVTLHRSAAAGPVMTMRSVAFIAVPAHGKADLAPGGYHLMLEGVRRPLHVGDKVPVSLSFAGGGAMRAVLRVRAGGGSMPGMAM